MLFNSYSFLVVFLPITLALFYTLLLKRGVSAAITGLWVASLAFYSWWNIRHLPILLASILGNYLIARAMVRVKGSPRRWRFALGIAYNLALLGWFKYAGFIGANLRAAGADITPIQLALPLGISFFTFQQIAFLRGMYAATDKLPGFVRYAGFISFFPHLIAGPILRHQEIQPQFTALKRNVPWDSILLGIAIFSLGLFKKVMIADPLGAMADPFFTYAARGEAISTVQGWAASFLYGFQLYFDFSGYSDMAIGLAHLFGIRFPQNFNSPYRSISIREFWQRWHMTLSQFFRDFLYIPLGGNRHGAGRMIASAAVTMALGGLWHGASWNFMLWGLLHGAYLGIHALWPRLGIALPTPLSWLLTLVAVMAAWILFRAPDLATAMHMYAAMFGPLRLSTNGLYMVLPWLAGCLAITLLLPNTVAFVREGAPLWRERFTFTATSGWCLILFTLFALAFLHVSRLKVFLYFNF